MPQFSIVIPTYNRGPYLLDALDSVLRQDLDDHEIIVVDDGSDDGTDELLAPYADRIRYVGQANAGAAAARNRGIALARGAWIGFLDSDDSWEPDTLSSVARAVAEHPAVGLVAIGAREVLADGTLTTRVYGKRSAGGYYTTASLIGADSGGCSWFFVRRELLRQVGGFDETLHSAEECDLTLRLSRRTRLYGIQRPLLRRRNHPGNISDDVVLNARGWIDLLSRFGRREPQWVRQHPWVYRRALGKARLRLGRELLLAAGNDRRARRRARSALRDAVRTYPFFLRGWSYLLWSRVPAGALRLWRQRELGIRSRRAAA